MRAGAMTALWLCVAPACSSGDMRDMLYDFSVAAMNLDGGNSIDGGNSAHLPTTMGTYRNTCDGSAGVTVDANHFLDFDDEDQIVRLYTRGASAAALQAIDISGAIGLTTTDEADFEDAARVGNRAYVMGSHGRDKNGTLAPARFRVVGIDVQGAVPDVNLTVAGWSDTLLVDMLNAANWDVPDAKFLSALNTASDLSNKTKASLAPKVNGTNIEGFGAFPSAQTPGRMLIGFRNPLLNGNAMLVTLTNVDDFLAGQKAHFGQAIALDLGGLAVRGLMWSQSRQSMFVIAGAIGEGGNERLYEWSGDPAAAPVVVQNIASQTGRNAEAILEYSGSHDLQILFDMGEFTEGGAACKSVPASTQYFDDAIVPFE